MRLHLASFLFCMSLAQFTCAQTQTGTKLHPARDASKLESEIEALQTEQQQIITRLDDLKQLLKANTPPVRSGPLAPQPPSTLDVHGESFRGDNGAGLAIVEYADFECPYCGEYERNVFPQLLRDYIQTGKVKYFYRDLPLSVHSRAFPAARAARCAGEQRKYWEMHDSLFEKQGDLSDRSFLDRARMLGLDNASYTECFTSDKYSADIRKSMSDAEIFGIEGTPTFFIGTIEGDTLRVRKAIQGSSPFEVFKTDLDSLLASNGPQSDVR